MCKVALTIPNEVLVETKMNKDTAEDFIRKTVALEYYKSKGVSLGFCAEIAQMTKADFIKYLGTQNISIFNFNNKESLLEDIYNA